MEDPLRVCVALAPLALYAHFVGVLNLGRRPYVLTTARDSTALGLGISGLMLIGPIELLAPEAAFERFGPFIWVMLATLYSLMVSLAVLLQRPGLVVYNVSLDEFRSAFAQAVDSIEPSPQWAGNTVSLPSQEVELHVSSYPLLRNITLWSVGDRQSLAGWRNLELALAAHLPQVAVRPSPIGVGLVGLGLLAVVGVIFNVQSNHEMLVKELQDLMGNF